MSANPVARSSSRRSVLVAAVAGLAAGGATYGVQAALVEPDPVFALIEAERRAMVRFDAACNGCDDVVNGREAVPSEVGEWQAAHQAQDAAIAAVMKGATTPAGLAAAMDLFLKREFENVPFRTDALLLDLFKSIRAHLGVPAASAGDVA